MEVDFILLMLNVPFVTLVNKIAYKPFLLSLSALLTQPVIFA